ncbi:MAG: dTMP kinase [Alphaproteobacteria bacterium]
MKGRFITFEGGDGTGKTTQISLLIKRLEERGILYLRTREPGGCKNSEQLRKLVLCGTAKKWLPLSETLLLYAARIEHWEKTIKPALSNGFWVLCDRFYDSTFAYQGYGHGVDCNFLKNLTRQALGNNQPDRTFIFDIDPEVGLDRSCSRLKQERCYEKRFESFDLSFHKRVRKGFLKIAEENKDRCLILDATAPRENLSDITWHDLVKKFCS